MQHHTRPDPTSPESFPTDPSGLPEATRPQLLELADGDTLDLQIGPVAKRLGDTTVRMLGYNGSIPGPTLKVRQGSEIVVHVTNEGDLDTTVHWHGLRLENKYDGVPHETQTPIPVGGEFTYRIRFPDAGLYWYHPHIREDYTQEMGLYGNILVVPAEPDYWPPADRDVLLTLDDLLVEDGKIAPFSPVETTYAAMGRFGNVLLISGEPDLRLDAQGGGGGAAVADQHRQHPGVQRGRARGADEAGRRRQRPGRARGVRLRGDAGPLGAGGGRRAVRPAGRADAGAPHPGPDLPAGHHHGDRGRPRIAVGGGGVRGAARAPELAAERQQLDRWLAAPPDKILALVAEMDDLAAMPRTRGRSPTPARCTPRSPATSRAAAPSAG